MSLAKLYEDKYHTVQRQPLKRSSFPPDICGIAHSGKFDKPTIIMRESLSIVSNPVPAPMSSTNSTPLS